MLAVRFFKFQIMNFDEEIKKHKDEIERLETLKQEQKRKSYPDCVGKYFRVAHSTFVKVKSIVDDYTDDYGDRYLEVECVYVRIETNSENAQIKSSSEMRIEADKNEISKEDFDIQFNRAFSIMQNVAQTDR